MYQYLFIYHNSFLHFSCFRHGKCHGVCHHIPLRCALFHQRIITCRNLIDPVGFLHRGPAVHERSFCVIDLKLCTRYLLLPCHIDLGKLTFCIVIDPFQCQRIRSCVIFIQILSILVGFINEAVSIYCHISQSSIQDIARKSLHFFYHIDA